MEFLHKNIQARIFQYLPLAGVVNAGSTSGVMHRSAKEYLSGDEYHHTDLDTESIYPLFLESIYRDMNMGRFREKRTRNSGMINKWDIITLAVLENQGDILVDDMDTYDSLAALVLEKCVHTKNKRISDLSAGQIKELRGVLYTLLQVSVPVSILTIEAAWWNTREFMLDLTSLMLRPSCSACASVIYGAPDYYCLECKTNMNSHRPYTSSKHVVSEICEGCAPALYKYGRVQHDRTKHYHREQDQILWHCPEMNSSCESYGHYGQGCCCPCHDPPPTDDSEDEDFNYLNM